MRNFFLKKQIGQIYDFFTTKVDANIIADLNDYYGLGKKEILQMMKKAGKLSTYLWQAFCPKTEEEIKKFYEENPFYVFELLLWHSTKYQRNLRKKFIGMMNGKVLDYGAGPGDFCLEIAKNGFEVDYADLQGKTFNFAKWFFKKRGQAIKMINLSQEKIFGKYDTILCIDVIEHVKNPKILLKEFSEHLYGNGRLIITALKPDVSEDKPMHFEMDFDPEKYLNSLGFIKKEEFLWIFVS